MLPNILFRLADCEHPLPPPPSGAAALRSPVDRRGTHPQQVGGGAANVPADLQGKVGKALQRGAEVAPVNVVPERWGGARALAPSRGAGSQEHRGALADASQPATIFGSNVPNTIYNRDPGVMSRGLQKLEVRLEENRILQTRIGKLQLGIRKDRKVKIATRQG